MSLTGGMLVLRAMVLGWLDGLFTSIHERVFYPSHRLGGEGNDHLRGRKTPAASLLFCTCWVSEKHFCRKPDPSLVSWALRNQAPMRQDRTYSALRRYCPTHHRLRMRMLAKRTCRERKGTPSSPPWTEQGYLGQHHCNPLIGSRFLDGHSSSGRLPR